jgi:hypothetical protein
LDNQPGEPETNGPDSRASQTSPADPSDKRIAIMTEGRGRLGKTVVSNATVQFCRDKGATLEVWNADRQNETHSLNLFHADALRPPSDDPEDKRLWLEARFDDQARRRFDSVLDIAGGDPLVRQLGKGARLVRTLERRNVLAVSMQVIGPDVADLDYLRLSLEAGLFMPNATLLVLNSGLVRSGRSVEGAFAEVTASKVFREALRLGAKVVWFPNLVCMSAVTDRGLTFKEALQGVAKPGQEPLSFFDQSRVEIFWEDELPKFFSAIPSDLLPTMPGWRR